MKKQRTKKELEEQNELLRKILSMVVDQNNITVTVYSDENLPDDALLEIIETEQAQHQAEQAFYSGYQMAFDVFEEKIQPIHSAQKRLEILGAQTDTLAALTPIPQTRKIIAAALQKLASDISEAYDQLSQAARNLDPELKEKLEETVGPKVVGRKEGIQRFISEEKDKGKYLRQVIKDRGGISKELSSQAMLQLVGGRPPGIAPWRTWLAQRIILIQEESGANYTEIGQFLLMELEACNKENLDSTKLEVLKKLGANRRPDRINTLIRRTVSDYKKALKKQAVR